MAEDSGTAAPAPDPHAKENHSVWCSECKWRRLQEAQDNARPPTASEHTP